MSEQPLVYSAEEVTAKLAAELPGWHLVDGELRREYKTGGWQVTLMLVNAIAYVAETAFHHPDLEVSYPSVVVKLSSHEAGGITEMDFALAQQIEAVALWRPAEDGPLKGGTTRKWVTGS